MASEDKKNRGKNDLKVIIDWEKFIKDPREPWIAKSEIPPEAYTPGISVPNVVVLALIAREYNEENHRWYFDVEMYPKPDNPDSVVKMLDKAREVKTFVLQVIRDEPPIEGSRIVCQLAPSASGGMQMTLQMEWGAGLVLKKRIQEVELEAAKAEWWPGKTEHRPPEPGFFSKLPVVGGLCYRIACMALGTTVPAPRPTVLNEPLVVLPEVDPWSVLQPSLKESKRYEMVARALLSMHAMLIQSRSGAVEAMRKAGLGDAVYQTVVERGMKIGDLMRDAGATVVHPATRVPLHEVLEVPVPATHEVAFTPRSPLQHVSRRDAEELRDPPPARIRPLPLNKSKQN